jgi:hypothetical protein
MTNLRDQRQATLGASYSIDRELGACGTATVYPPRVWRTDAPLLGPFRSVNVGQPI